MLQTPARDTRKGKMGVVVPTENNRACEEDLKGCPALHTLFQYGFSEHRSVGQISANMQSVQWKNWYSFPWLLDSRPGPGSITTQVWCWGEGCAQEQLTMEGFRIASSTWLTSPMGPWGLAYRFPEAY